MALRKRRPGLVYPTYEDWHYVGETDEPAFATGWSNFGGGVYSALAFRRREPGIVDMTGYVTTDATGNTTLFQLPEGYRPSAAYAVMYYQLEKDATSELVIRIASVASNGNVFLAGSDAASNRAMLSGSFFLDVATAAP